MAEPTADTPLTDAEVTDFFNRLTFYAVVGLKSIHGNTLLGVPGAIDMDNVQKLIDYWTALAEERIPDGAILSQRLVYLCMQLLDQEITAAMASKAVGIAAVMDPEAGGKA